MPALSYYFKALCPYCDSRLPIRFNATTNCNGIFVKCKNRDCRAEFELVIDHGRQLVMPKENK